MAKHARKKTVSSHLTKGPVPVVPSGPPLLVGMPTHDNRAVIQTVMEFTQLGGMLGRPVQFLISRASNIPRGRNVVMDAARQASEADPLWIFWIDSDILLLPGQLDKVARMIRTAEAQGVGVTAHYRMDNGESMLMADRSMAAAHYTLDEITQMPRGATIGMAGMGFCYLPMPRATLFHADQLGEDVVFFQQYPDLTLTVDPTIELRHWKSAWF